MVSSAGLGKLLHCKREGPSEEGEGAASSRRSLTFSPEEVVASAGIGEEALVDFLHENYPSFFAEAADAADATLALSTADLFQARFLQRSALAPYAQSVAARGVLHSNRHPVSGHWLPLYKPVGAAVRKEAEALQARVQAAFPGTATCQARALMAQSLALHPRLHELSREQQSCVRDMARFPARLHGQRTASRFGPGVPPQPHSPLLPATSRDVALAGAAL